MFDRETLIGVAVFDGRVTGEALVNSELELIFHLLEQVSLAVRNIWLHDQLASNHDLMTGVLREMGSACLVVNRDLKILHANKTGTPVFQQEQPRGGATWNSPTCRKCSAAKFITCSALAPPSPRSVHTRIRARRRLPRHDCSVPTPARGPAASALLIADDLTQSEQLRRLEVETVSLRLIKTMAERLAHEVGNALVPLSTHQQLLAEKISRPGFPRVARHRACRRRQTGHAPRATNALSRAGRRRLQEAFPSSRSSRKPIRRRDHLPAQPALLHCDTNGSSMVITGDRAALKTRAHRSHH